MKKQRSKVRRRKLNKSQLEFGVLEPRRVLAAGVAGNDCPPDLDLSGVSAQSVSVGELFTLDILHEEYPM